MQSTAVTAAVTVALCVTGCSGGKAPSAPDDERPGDPNIYLRIDSLTSCDGLEHEFEIAIDDAEARRPSDPLRESSLAYAEAAVDRMRALDFYR
jgi:hypothetical protein